MDIAKPSRPARCNQRIPIFLAALSLVFASPLALAQTSDAGSGSLAITGSKIIYVDKVYDNSKKSDDIKTFVFSFNRQDDRVFSFELNDHLIAKFNRGKAAIIRRNAGTNVAGQMLYEARLSEHATQAAIAFEVMPDDVNAIQLIETDEQHNYVNASPIYTVATAAQGHDTPGNLPNIVAIDNDADRGTLQVHRVSFDTRANVHLRNTRSLHAYQLECLVPLLAIANKLLNTPCNLIKEVLTPVHGYNENISGTNTPKPAFDGKELEWRLTDLTLTHGRDPYVGYAASESCHVPLRAVFSTRKKRAPDNDCVFEVFDVLTPYLILMDYDFDRETFGQVVQTILATRSTGLDVQNPDVETELIDAVFAAQARASAGQGRAASELAEELRTASTLHASTLTFQEVVPSAPAGVSHALGTYELQLGAYTQAQFRAQYPEVMPRTWNGQRWVHANDFFTTEVVRNPSRDQITMVQNTLRDWYPAIQLDRGLTGENSLLLSGSRIAHAMENDLDTPDENDVIVIVRYQGRIVNLLQGGIANGSPYSHLYYAVSAPTSLRVPYTTEAIRGGGQRALQQFIDHSLGYGARVITTNAATHVSAEVKFRFGFRHEDEL
ncbi:hypothetical protein FHW69_001196 [Luteibacter sp. Sphag1AF]|uniref:hypothetical protein n=1 Tax=Luteibacter sp. Sphag1AF TaxID=2587031 RepID=UPI00161BBE37|nr:hypothetical protein [Luteibacter sp. Sphag1AF]MBB3226606.1 hypothetical protein [Luteibacter sp. Sphag1AF]